MRCLLKSLLLRLGPVCGFSDQLAYVVLGRPLASVVCSKVTTPALTSQSQFADVCPWFETLLQICVSLRPQLLISRVRESCHSVQGWHHGMHWS